MEAASIRPGAHAAGTEVHDDHHHGPPEAHRSSRVEPQLLGMLLFIISEIMVFGAFFTAYFFIRIVQGDEWPAAGTQAYLACGAGPTTSSTEESCAPLHSAMNDQPSSHACSVIWLWLGRALRSASESDAGRATRPSIGNRHSKNPPVRSRW